MSTLPATFLGRSDREDIEDDVAGAPTTVEERAVVLEALCRLAAEQTAQHPRPQAVLDWRDPLPEDSEILLARLRARARAGRG